jgi:hypothetical protein
MDCTCVASVYSEVMISPQMTTKTEVTGITATRRKLQDACRHLRGFDKVHFCYWGIPVAVLVCTDCKRPAAHRS